jgi:SAM-dependent methyltransferase
MSGTRGLEAAYIHGTAPSEQARLAALNRITNRAFVEFVVVPPGARVLEVGSGLGLLAVEVAESNAGVRVVGLEQSTAQIEAAARSAGVEYRQGDAHELPFPDASFDLAYARYLLEHVQRPERVVAEMRRVVRPGGCIAVCENDISLLRVDPPCPAFDRVWGAFQDYQRRLGGDARVGGRLYRLLRGAGLSQVELSVLPEVHWHGSPCFAAWIENLIGNVEGARKGLVESGATEAPLVEDALGELHALLRNADASSVFIWNRARATV